VRILPTSGHIYHWATWAMPRPRPFELPEISRMAMAKMQPQRSCPILWKCAGKSL